MNFKKSNLKKNKKSKTFFLPWILQKYQCEKATQIKPSIWKYTEIPLTAVMLPDSKGANYCSPLVVLARLRHIYLFISGKKKKTKKKNTETEGMFLVQKLYKWSKIPTPFLYYGNFKHEIRRVAGRLREEYISHFCSLSPGFFFECLIPMSIQGDPLHWYFKEHRQVGWKCLQNTSCRSV